MTPETERLKRDVDAYQETVERMEPGIHMIDAGAAYASVAISLKRQADAMEKIEHHLSTIAGWCNANWTR